CRRAARGDHGRADRMDRTPVRRPHGGNRMIASRYSLACGLAALLMAASVMLPSASAPAAGLLARPVALAMTLAAALLFALAGRRGPAAIGCGLAGVIVGCAVALALLADPHVAGAAAIGFWAIVVATWIAAAVSVTRLSALRPASKGTGRALGLAVPLLFGAFLFFL